MKRKLLIGFTVATMSFANMSYADFTFYSNTNSCDVVSGRWSGNGSASNWLLTCKYHGTGAVSTVESSGHFTLEVNADKDSGSFLCPEHHTEKLHATCVNGVVTVKTQYGDLSGNFSQNTGTAKGKLTVSSGIDVDVNIQFNRAG